MKDNAYVCVCVCIRPEGELAFSVYNNLDRSKLVPRIDPIY